MLRFWFDTWFGAISPPFLRMAQVQESLAQPSLFDAGPALLAPGIMCTGPQRSRMESRRAEVLSSIRVQRVRILQRFLQEWHSAMLWQQHCRFVSEMVRSEKIPTQQEPDAEPSIAPKASLHSIATDLRSWYRTVVFLDYGGIRQLRVKSALQVLRPSMKHAEHGGLTSNHHVLLYKKKVHISTRNHCNTLYRSCVCKIWALSPETPAQSP